MSEQRKKRPVFTTPKGRAVFPRVNKPDTKFNPDGDFSVKLSLTEAEAAPLIEKLEGAAKESFASAVKENKGKKVKQADLPFKQETDQEGNETGNLLFNFKLKAKVTKQDGESYTQRPSIYDAKGKSVDPAKTIVGGGSIIKVAYEIFPFFTALIGAGISLRLKAVQVLELVEYGERSAKSYGFGEEEGYSAEDMESDSNFGASSDSPAAEESANEDF